MCMQISSRTTCLHLYPYFVYTSSEDSGMACLSLGFWPIQLVTIVHALVHIVPNQIQQHEKSDLVSENKDGFC